MYYMDVAYAHAVGAFCEAPYRHVLECVCVMNSIRKHIGNACMRAEDSQKK